MVKKKIYIYERPGQEKMSLGTAADWHRAASELEKQTPQLGHIKETWNS